MSVYMRGLTEKGIDKDLSTGFLFVAATAANKQAAEAYLDSKFERVDSGFWRIPKPSLKDAPLSFVKTATSGTASAEVIARRKVSCFGGTGTPPCPALVTNERGAFCSECKCAQWRGARMDGWKITRSYLECPRGKAGFSNEVNS